VQSYGLALDLRDDPALIARYKKEHAKVWPEVLARLREIGVTEMKIYLLGRRMFMYCETKDGFDPARDFARSTEDPTYRNWDELMRTLQERAPEAEPGEWWAMMELVFDLNRASAPGSPRRSPALAGRSSPWIVTLRSCGRRRRTGANSLRRSLATSRTALRTTPR